MKFPTPAISRAGKLITHTPTDGDLITIYASTDKTGHAGGISRMELPSSHGEFLYS